MEDELRAINKGFTFDKAHALENYRGKCKTIHGHTYVLHVTVSGNVNKKPNHSFEGMIVDFVDLMHWVNKQVIEEFYLNFVLDEKGVLIKSLLIEKNSKLLAVDYVPTCENMLLDNCKRLKSSIHTALTLKWLLFYETPTYYAECNNNSHSI